ncbi:MAG: hypothetical protein QW327_00850, partial [Candidatus Odinarchaeota archaeon]
MPEGSFAGAKIISVLIGIVGILLIIVGATSILAISIPGLPPEVIAALTSLSSNAYIQIVYGLIAIGIAVGLWGARAWAAGAAGVLLLIILVSTGFSIYSLWVVYGLSGLYTLLTSLSIPLIITIVTFIVALAS